MNENPYAPPATLEDEEPKKSGKSIPENRESWLTGSYTQYAVPLILFEWQKKFGFDDRVLNNLISTQRTHPEIITGKSLDRNTTIYKMLHEDKNNAIIYHKTSESIDNDKYEIGSVNIDAFKPNQADEQTKKAFHVASQKIIEHNNAICNILDKSQVNARDKNFYEEDRIDIFNMLNCAELALNSPEKAKKEMKVLYKIDQEFSPNKLYEKILQPSLLDSLEHIKMLVELTPQEISDAKMHMQAMKDTLTEYRDSIDMGVHQLLYQQAEIGLNLQQKAEKTRPEFLQKIFESQKLDVSHSDVAQAKGRMPFP